jgi:hypothetical protein
MVQDLGPGPVKRLRYVQRPIHPDDGLFHHRPRARSGRFLKLGIDAAFLLLRTRPAARQSLGGITDGHLCKKRRSVPAFIDRVGDVV